MPGGPVRAATRTSSSRLISENDRGQWSYACGRPRYGRERQPRVSSRWRVRRDRGDGLPDDGDGRRRGGVPQLDGDARLPDAYIPFYHLPAEITNSGRMVGGQLSR
jgi:hypothetical protein